MISLPFIIFIIVWGILIIKYKFTFSIGLISLLIGIVISVGIVCIDYNIQTADTEVWSGRVADWQHKEEWDEWHPPRTETYTTTNSKGSTTTHTKIIPGYWEHHYAENRIKTTDDGWVSVSVSPTGRKMNDAWPNKTEELKAMWPLNTPSASTHTYENKVQASYSIYRHKEIDLKKYPDLPEYPSNVRNYINIDRIIGEVPNKKEALVKVADWNAELNKAVPDPEKPGKTKSWKQVNIIFVNVGDKPENYGFALQDKWEGGNKNDFVVAFSMDSNNNIKWVYPFSWSEVEMLKIEVRDYMLNLKQINDFVPVVDKVSKMVSEEFVRKQFAEFNYLQIDISTGATVCIWILNIIVLGASVYVAKDYENNNNRKRKYYWR